MNAMILFMDYKFPKKAANNKTRKNSKWTCSCPKHLYIYRFDYIQMQGLSKAILILSDFHINKIIAFI
jgi:hypothetical protein